MPMMIECFVVVVTRLPGAVQCRKIHPLYRARLLLINNLVNGEPACYCSWRDGRRRSASFPWWHLKSFVGAHQNVFRVIEYRTDTFRAPADLFEKVNDHGASQFACASRFEKMQDYERPESEYGCC